MSKDAVPVWLLFCEQTAKPTKYVDAIAKLVVPTSVQLVPLALSYAVIVLLVRVSRTQLFGAVFIAIVLLLK